MADVNIDILAKLTGIDQSLRAFDDFQKSVSDNLKKIDSGLSNVSHNTSVLGGVIGTAALAFTAFNEGIELVKKLADALHEPVRQALDSESAVTRLNVALKLSGNFTQESSKHFQELAESVQKATGLSEEHILNQVALAQSFNISNQRAEQLIKAAIDLSAATGIDLDTAVRQLGQTFDGTAGRLRETIPQLQNLTKSELEAGAAVDIVSKRFKGAADAIGNTFGGGIKKSEAAFDDLLKTIGKLVTQNPVLLAVLQNVPDILGTIEEFLRDNSDAIGDFISQGISGLINILPNMIALLRTSANIYGTLLKSVELLGAGFLELLRQIDSIKIIDAIFKGIAQAVVLAGTSVLTLISSLAGFGPVKKVLESVGINVDSVKDSLASLKDKGFEIANTIDNFDISAALQRGEDGMFSLREKTDDAFNEIDNDLADAENAMRDFGDTIQNVADNEVQGFQDATSEIENQAKVARGLSADVQSEIGKIFSAVNKPTESTLNITTETQKIDVAFNDSVSQAAKDFNDTVAKAQSDQSKSIAAFSKQQTSLVVRAAQETDPTKRAVIQQQALQARINFESQAQQTFNEIQAKALQSRLDVEQKASIAKQKAENELRQRAFDDEQKRQSDSLNKSTEAATKVIAFAGAQLGEKFLGIPKEIGGPIIEAFAKGPESVKAFFGGIIDAAPQVIVNIVKSVPVLIQTLIDKLPDVITTLIADIPQIIDALIAGTPKIIESLAIQMTLQGPKIVFAIIKEIPQIVAHLLTDIGQSLSDVLDDLFSFLGPLNPFKHKQEPIPTQTLAGIPIGDSSGGGGGTSNVIVGGSTQSPADIAAAATKAAADAVNTSVTTFSSGAISAAEAIALQAIADAAAHATTITSSGSGIGGQLGATGTPNFFAPVNRRATGGEIPEGFPNDSFISRLTSGENVIDNSTNKKLNSFLDNQSNSFESLIAAINKGTEKEITVKVQVGERELASTILNLNRQGWRLTG